MFQSVAAIVAGFFVIVVLVLGSTPLVARLTLRESTQTPTPPYLTANLLAGFACAAAGGWVAVRLAPAAPTWHGGALAALVLALGVLTAAQGGAARAGQPMWYAWLLPFVGAAGVLLGGWLGR